MKGHGVCCRGVHGCGCLHICGSCAGEDSDAVEVSYTCECDALQVCAGVRWCVCVGSSSSYDGVYFEKVERKLYIWTIGLRAPAIQRCGKCRRLTSTKYGSLHT